MLLHSDGPLLSSVTPVATKLYITHTDANEFHSMAKQVNTVASSHRRLHPCFPRYCDELA